MDLNLKDKVIIVTGGAKGIGEGITRVLASEGAFPVILGRNEDDNNKLIQAIGTGGQVAAELSKPEQCKAAVDAVVKKYGRIDGVVNNAGVNDGVSLESGTYEAFMQSLHSNVVHYFLVVQAALPELIKNKGSIVNIGSKVAETGQGGTSGYAASNGGRNALTREWAIELLKYGIRVNSVIVAECYTPLYDRWIKTLSNPEETLKKITDRIPLGKRMTTSEEIANMVTFLLSDRSSHTTGQIIHVDGGYVHLDRAALT
ncbi:MAG: SDR family oxidoreductase [bacterium]|jgi:L-fucose dehydrogenase